MPPKKASKSKDKEKDTDKGKEDKVKSPSKNAKPKTPDTKSKSKKDKDKDQKGKKKKKSSKNKPEASEDGDGEKEEKKRLTLADLGKMILKFCTCCAPAKVKKDYWAPFERDKKKSAELRAARDESIRVAEEERQRLLNHNRLQYLAAVRIQCLIRGVLGRIHAQEMWRYAMDCALAYWENYWYMRWMQTQQDGHAKTARQRGLYRFVQHSIAEGALLYTLRSNASTVIQKVWRGFSTRLLGLLDYRPKRWRRRVVPSRFSLDVYRRIWGRSVYMPLGGWPGRKDTISYDMWQHIDRPPKGRAFGVRTRKVVAVPRSEREKQLLMHDRNAWVGVPVTWEEGEQGPMDSRRLAEAMATAPGFEERLRKMRSDAVLAEADEEAGSQALDQEGGGSTPASPGKLTILDKLLLTSPYRHPVIHPTGYVPLNPDELVASFGGPMAMGKDKTLLQARQVATAAKLDEAWLERSVEAEDKARRAERLAQKAFAEADARNSGFRDALLTYRGVVNEVTGEYSVTSEVTGDSALGHLLVAKTHWDRHGETEPSERNFGQIVTDIQGKRPIAQATPIRGARKPMTERHKVSLDIEKAKATRHRERVLAARVERLLSGEGARTGVAAAEEDAVLNAAEPAPPDPHVVLLGRFGHRNHLMSKRSRKIIDHSRWSLVQHRSHRAAQAEHNAKRNSMNAHATATDLFARATGGVNGSRSKTTAGAGTMSVLTGGEFSLATAGSDVISAQMGGPTGAVIGRLVKGSAMDEDDFDDDTAVEKRKSGGKSKGRNRSPSPGKKAGGKSDRSPSPGKKAGGKSDRSPSPGKSRSQSQSPVRDRTSSPGPRKKDHGRRSPSRSPSPGRKGKKDKKFVNNAKGGSQITFTGDSAPGSDWTEIKEDIPAEKRREHRDALAARVAAAAAEEEVPPATGITDAEAEALMGYWTSSPWGQLKEQMAAEVDRSGGLEPLMPFADDAGLQRRTLYRRPKEVASKVRVWPVRPRQHYKLRYSWLPQPLVNRAAIAVYDPDAAHRTPLAPVRAEDSVYLVPGSAQSQASLSTGSARSSPMPWARAAGNIDEEELTVATNLMDAMGDADADSAADDRASPPVRYIQHDVGGQRWTSVASESKAAGVGGVAGYSSDEGAAAAFHKPHARRAIEAANGDERGRARERVRVKSSSHRGDSRLRDSARRMQKSPAATVNKKGLRASLKKRHAYVDLSSDEEDDADTGATGSHMRTNVNTSAGAGSSKFHLPSSVGGSMQMSDSADGSLSLPTASQFSGGGMGGSGSRSGSAGAGASGFSHSRSSKRPRRRREVQSADEFQFEGAESAGGFDGSFDGSGVSAERSDIFDPHYYDRRGHVVPKARGRGPTAQLMAGTASDSPDRPDDKLHPYQWL